MLMSPVLLSSTRGLDASTALEFVRALRIATDVCRLTTIVSIYQAGESLYQHFDKVCVLYEGRMAYFGRADQARQYFIDLGYEPANRQTTADFIVAGMLQFNIIYSTSLIHCSLVTDPAARIIREDFKGQVPRTAEEFAQTFLASAAGMENRADIDSYRNEFVGKPERVAAYRESAIAEHASTSRKGSAYTISIPMQARAVMLRRLQILRGNIATELIIVM
jgi:ATP-binding cassette subfamily G (WHITE) protein 2 (SNQ2)